MKVTNNNLSTYPLYKVPFRHSNNNEFKERNTIMDIRRKYDRKMRREYIGGIIVMAVAFVMMILTMRWFG